MALAAWNRQLSAAFFSIALAFPALSGPARASLVDTFSVAAPEERLAGPGALEPEPLFRFGLRMRAAGNLAEAKRSLAEVDRLFPGTPWAARASLVLGLIATQEKDSSALELLARAEAIGDLGDYITFFRADALAALGRHGEAALAYGSVAASYPVSALAERASLSRGAALLGSGDHAAAAEALGAFVKAFPRSQAAPEALAMLAASRASTGQGSQEASALKELVVGYPASGKAPEALRRLARLEAAGVKEATFSPQDRYRRAEAMFRNASFAQAIEEYGRLLGAPEYRDRALYRIAVANARLKRYQRAEALLKEYLSGKGLRHEPEALYWYATVSSRLGREEGLVEAERALAKKYPASEERAKTLTLIGRFKEGKDPEGSLGAYRAVIDAFGAAESSDDAYWSMAWGAYSSGRFGDAYDGFSAYLGVRPSGRDAARFLYWKGRSAERLGRPEEAAAVFERVCGAADSYYCLMASARAAAEGRRAGFFVTPASFRVSEARSAEAGAPPLSSLAGQRRYRAAIELLALGLRDEAAEEMDLLARTQRPGKEGLAELATMLYGAGDFYRAFRIYRRHLSGDSEMAHLGFPLALVEAAEQKAGSGDPFLVAAVAREESHFNPGAVSPVGALGIMQIMPSTGKGIARQMGVEFDKARLLEPDVSLRFGSWYLGRLLERFGGDLVLAVAGYNAGPNAAARWARELPQEMDEFIESIPYNETRAYTKRVLRSYAGFLRLAGKDPVDRMTRGGPYPAPPAVPGEAGAAWRSFATSGAGGMSCFSRLMTYGLFQRAASSFRPSPCYPRA